MSTAPVIRIGDLTFYSGNIAVTEWLPGDEGRPGPTPENPNQWNPVEQQDVPGTPPTLRLIFIGGGIYDAKGDTAIQLKAALEK
jgi:hypothetical protein